MFSSHEKISGKFLLENALFYSLKLTERRISMHERIFGKFL